MLAAEGPVVVFEGGGGGARAECAGGGGGCWGYFRRVRAGGRRVALDVKDPMFFFRGKEEVRCRTGGDWTTRFRL